MSKKNWNDLIEKEQVILDRIVTRDVHVICNELMDWLEDDYDFSSINSWDFDDEPKEFDMSDYDQPSASKAEPIREMTEDEYLWWSADNTS